MFNSRVTQQVPGISHSLSNSSIKGYVNRKSHSSQANVNMLKDGINMHRNGTRKGSNQFISPKSNRIGHSRYLENMSKTQHELGSLMLNSPISKHTNIANKIRTGVASQVKTCPSIPFKKHKPEGTISPAKYSPNYDLLHKKSPVAMIKAHNISGPQNNGSLNRYIEVFIHNVVDSTGARPHQSPQMLTSPLHSSVVENMSSHMSKVVNTYGRVKGHDTDDSFYIEASEMNSIALNTAPIDTNYKMRSPFASKTQRYKDIKPTPGPGAYNVMNEGELPLRRL